MTKLIYEPGQTTHWKNLFPSKMQLLGSQNFNPDEELVAEIESVAISEVRGRDGKAEKIPVLKFTNAPEMALNVTNTRTIASLYGPYYDGWVGKSIQIYTTMVSAFGKETLALRIRESKPNVDIDITKYEKSLMQCESIEDLQIAYGEIPKHIRPRLIDIKDAMKEKLSDSE